ncbi:MAG TPA: hypothetical protein VGG39_01835 [Polyangiaceae bacterium]|jgi:hypothetical protein
MFVINSIARPLVLLDANAVRYCFKPPPGMLAADEVERLRKTMRGLARLDYVRFVVTQPVGWELTQVYDEEGADAYADLVEFYFAIGSEWVLIHEHKREPLELRLGRKLKLKEAFPTRIDLSTSLAMHRDPNHVKQLHDMQRQHKDEELEREAARRLALVPALDAAVPNWRKTFHDEAATAWAKVVRGFAKQEMRKLARELGLRIAPTAWPRPDDLPTFWYAESFYVAKFLSVFVDTEKKLTSNKSIKAMPDMMDATHFRDAAYADVLVTQDVNFAAVATRASTGLLVLSFDDFARRVLAQAPALGVS